MKLREETTTIQYEMADRAETVATGGMGAVCLVTRRSELDTAINRYIGLLKPHLPYHESDHVLSIAYNLLAVESLSLEFVSAAKPIA